MLFITFFPAVMVAATVGGFWLGIVATCLTALIVDYWFLRPVGLFEYSSAADVVSLSLFFCMGVFMSSVAGLYHRALQRAAAYEKDLAVCESEERYRELDAHTLDFYRRTIVAATDGKLLISEPGEIEPVGCGEIGSWDITDLAGLGRMRDQVADLARKAGMDEQRVISFLGCIVEAGSNAIKHAGGGKARLCSRNDDLICIVSDSGPGIGALALPDVALTEGFSTAGTLGMGYKVMLRFSDQVRLATGPEGTTVAIWMSLYGAEAPLVPSAARLSGWTG